MLPATTVVYIDSTIVNPLGALLPQKGVVKKLKSKLLQNRNRNLRAF